MKVYTSMIENKASVVLLKKPGEIRVEQINLDPLTEDDLLVENFYSGISSGTERLLLRKNAHFKAWGIRWYPVTNVLERSRVL